jgi:hypothetical protein
MTIRQFNGSYIASDDRIILRFNTTNDQEYRFWFTRRITQFIISATEHLVEKQLEKKHEKPIAKAISEFKVEVAHKTANFNTEYQSATKFPLGGDPILVIDAKCAILKYEEEDILSLDLIMPNQKKLNLKLVQAASQTMCVLLQKLNDQANWGAPTLPQTLKSKDLLAEPIGSNPQNVH